VGLAIFKLLFFFLAICKNPYQKKQIRIARMTPNEANKKPFVSIRVMGSEARDFLDSGVPSGHEIYVEIIKA